MQSGKSTMETHEKDNESKAFPGAQTQGTRQSAIDQIPPRTQSCPPNIDPTNYPEYGRPHGHPMNAGQADMQAGVPSAGYTPYMPHGGMNTPNMMPRMHQHAQYSKQGSSPQNAMGGNGTMHHPQQTGNSSHASKDMPSQPHWSPYAQYYAGYPPTGAQPYYPVPNYMYMQPNYSYGRGIPGAQMPIHQQVQTPKQPGPPHQSMGQTQQHTPAIIQPRKSKAIQIIDPNTRKAVDVSTATPTPTPPATAQKAEETNTPSARPEEDKKEAAQGASSSPTVSVATPQGTDATSTAPPVQIVPKSKVTLTRPDGTAIKLGKQEESDEVPSQEPPIPAETVPVTKVAEEAEPPLLAEHPQEESPQDQVVEAAEEDHGTRSTKADGQNEVEEKQTQKEEDSSRKAVEIPTEVEVKKVDKGGEGGNDKLVYTREFLLKFKELCLEKPPNMPSTDFIQRRDPGREKSKDGWRGRSGPGSKPPGGMRRPSGPPPGVSMPGRMPKQGSSGSVAQIPRSTLPHHPGNAPPSSKYTKWNPKREKSMQDEVVRKCTGLLNKLTIENFPSVSDKIMKAGITSDSEILGRVISLIFEKAILEPKYSKMYADLCVKLAGSESLKEFRRLLLNKCQEEFESNREEERQKWESLPAEEREEMDFMFRKRMRGNVRFIGELFKQNMLKEQIMHICINSLLRNPDVANLEALCKLLSTIGKRIDVPGKGATMDQYMERMRSLSHDPNVETRIRFLLKNVIELRQNKWVPRRKEENPLTIKEVHMQAQEDELAQQRLTQQRSSHLGRMQPSAILQRPNFALSGGPRVRTTNRSERGGGKQQSSRPNIAPASGRPFGGDVRKGNEAPSSRSQGGAGRGSLTSGAPAKLGHSSSLQGLMSKSSSPSVPKYSLSSILGQNTKQQQTTSTAQHTNNSFQVLQGREYEEEEEDDDDDDEYEEEDELKSTSGSKSSPVDKLKSILDEYFYLEEVEEALECICDLRIKPEYHSGLVSECLEYTLSKNKDVGSIVDLLQELLNQSVISSNAIESGISLLFENLEEMTEDLPIAPQVCAKVIFSLYLRNMVSLAFLAKDLLKCKESGCAERVLGELIKSLCNEKGVDAVRDLLNSNGLRVSEFLREGNPNERALEFQQKYGFSPSSEKIHAPSTSGRSVKEVEEWLVNNVSSAPTEASVHEIVSNMLACARPNTKDFSVESIAYESTELERWIPVLSKYIAQDERHQTLSLQEIHDFCKSAAYPQGLLERLFNFMYDKSVVSSAVFESWRVSASNPTALSQTEEWFSWMRSSIEDREEEEE